LPAVQAPLEMMKLRVVADFLEIVITGKKGGSVTLKFDPDGKRDLASHRALIEVMRLAAEGPLKLMVMSEGRPNIPAEVALPDIEVDAALDQFSNVIACFEKATAGVLPPELAVSQREIDIAWNAIVDFNGLVAGTDFKGAFEFAEVPKDTVSSRLPPSSSIMSRSASGCSVPSSGARSSILSLTVRRAESNSAPRASSKL
jgi:hypothetical protein